MSASFRAPRAAAFLAFLAATIRSPTQDVLGYHGVDTVVHRDNICLTTGVLFGGGGSSGDLVDRDGVAD